MLWYLIQGNYHQCEKHPTYKLRGLENLKLLQYYRKQDLTDNFSCSQASGNRESTYTSLFKARGQTYL